MTTFYRSSKDTENCIFEAHAANGARFFVMTENAKLVWASVGSVRTGTWSIGCGGLQTIGDLRRLFHKLAK